MKYNEIYVQSYIIEYYTFLHIIILLLFPLRYISTLESKQTRSLMHSKHSNDAVGVVMLFLPGDIITIQRNNSPQTRFQSWYNGKLGFSL